MTFSTSSSTLSPPLPSTRSGSAGGSYGAPTPVIPDKLTGAGPGVETLRVALLAELQRRIDEDLDEGQLVRRVQLGGHLAVGRIGTDEADKRDRARLGKQPGDVGGAPDVLGARAFVEAEVTVQAVPQVVAIEQQGRHGQVRPGAPRPPRRPSTCRRPGGP